MESARKIIAVVIGIAMLIFLVLVAKWTGEKIRERFFTPKPIITNQILPQQPVIVEDAPVATYAAIPKTGPAETGLILLGFLLTGGLSSLALARKSS